MVSDLALLCTALHCQHVLTDSIFQHACVSLEAYACIIIESTRLHFVRKGSPIHLDTAPIPHAFFGLLSLSFRADLYFLLPLFCTRSIHVEGFVEDCNNQAYRSCLVAMLGACAYLCMMHQCCTDARSTDVAALWASRQQPPLPSDNSPDRQQTTALGASRQQHSGPADSSPQGQQTTALRASR